MLELLNAGSLVAGALVHTRLTPPLGQLPGLEAALGIPRSFPAALAFLHFGQLPLQDSALGALLSAAACALHAATHFRFRHAAARVRADGGIERERSAAVRDVPWLLRLVPVSPLCGVVPLLPRMRGEAAISIERAVSYYPPGCAPSPRCVLDVWYRPASAASTTTSGKAVLYLHGGAWNIGHRLWHADTALLHRLASEGAVVFSASYRFAHEAPFPACLEDAAAALAFAHGHASRYGADPRAGVVVIGASAGGHLATLLATASTRAAVAAMAAQAATAEDSLAGVSRRSSGGSGLKTTATPEKPAVEVSAVAPVEAVVLFYPAVDVRDSLKLHLTFPTCPPLLASAMAAALRRCWPLSEPSASALPSRRAAGSQASQLPHHWLHARARALRGMLQSVSSGRSLFAIFFEACVLCAPPPPSPALADPPAPPPLQSSFSKTGRPSPALSASAGGIAQRRTRSSSSGAAPTRSSCAQHALAAAEREQPGVEAAEQLTQFAAAAHRAHAELWWSASPIDQLEHLAEQLRVVRQRERPSGAMGPAGGGARAGDDGAAAHLPLQSLALMETAAEAEAAAAAAAMAVGEATSLAQASGIDAAAQAVSFGGSDSCALPALSAPLLPPGQPQPAEGAPPECQYGAEARFPPTLIIHGSHDSIIPLESSELLLRMLTALDNGGEPGGCELCAASAVGGLNRRTFSDTDIDAGADSSSLEQKQSAEPSGGKRICSRCCARGRSNRLRRHTLVPVAGARHSFSWLLSAPTVATHDLVAEWIVSRT